MLIIIHLIRHAYDLKMPPQDSPDYVKLQPFDDEVGSFQVGHPDPIARRTCA